MQLAHQADEFPVLLKINPHGLPHPLPVNNPVQWDPDVLAALNHGLHHHASRMAKAVDLGDLHSVEFHLDTGEVIAQHRSDCGDLWVRSTP
jgi:hypothetical protein